ncbi:MAG: hypothetical protein QXZ62_07865 [Candidatus Caldarchaeum sp.]
MELTALKEYRTLGYRMGCLISSRNSIQDYRRPLTEELEEVNECLKILTHPGLDTFVMNLEEVNPRWKKT